MAQGNYSESQFLQTSTAPPDGGIWLWVDETRGQVKWVKLSHVTHDGHEVENLVQQLKTFSLDLTLPRDIGNSILPKSRQDWTIGSQTHYRALGYTLFRIDYPLSSRAVNSADGGSFSGQGFTFMASGNAIWYASGSGTALNPTLATGVTSSRPQGYFPKTTSYPREQFFRGYGQTQWFTEDGVATTNMGQITDPNSSFRNGRTEVNNTPNSSTAQASSANVLPFFMDAANSVYSLSESQILDLAPTPPGPPPPPPSVDVAQIRFAVFPSGRSRSSTVDQLCGSTANQFAANAGQGMVLDIAGSQALTLSGGKYKIRSGTSGTSANTSEITRQVNYENRVWGSQSIKTNGLGVNTNGTGGNFMISTNPNAAYNSIEGNVKAVASLESSSDGRIRLNRITYCSTTPPPLTYSYTRTQNTVQPFTSATLSRHRDNQPHLSGQPVADAWARGSCQRYVNGAPVSYWITTPHRYNIIRELVNAEACTPGRNFLNSRIWYQSQGRADIILADGNTLQVTRNTGFWYPASGNVFGIAGISSSPAISNDNTGGMLTIRKYY